MSDKETDDLEALIDMVEVEVDDDDAEVATESETEDAGETEGDGDGEDEAEPDGEESEPDESAEQTEEEKEEKRKWPKLTSKERRERKRRAEEHTKRELEAAKAEALRLRQEQAEIRQQLSMLQAQAVDSTLAQIDHYYQQAQAAYIDAVNNGDRENAAKADQFMQNLVIDRAKHIHQKQIHIEQAKPKPVQHQPQVSPVVASYADKFQRDNPWFETDATGNPRNDETAIALAIDKLVSSEGYSPDTPEYWQVLQQRISRAMKRETPPPAPRAKGGPVLGNGKPSTKKSALIGQDWVDAFGGGEIGKKKAAEYLKRYGKTL